MTADNILKILNTSKSLIMVSLIFFIIGSIAGFLSFEKTEKQLLPLLQNVVFANIVQESRFQTAINILSRNIWVATIVLISGITIIIPLIITFTNGFIVGFAFKLILAKNLDIIVFIKGVLPHSIFELPAFLISAAIGIRTGIIILSSRKNTMKNLISHMKEMLIIYFCVIIPLLVIAAFVEAFVSAALVMGS